MLADAFKPIEPLLVLAPKPGANLVEESLASPRAIISISKKSMERFLEHSEQQTPFSRQRGKRLGPRTEELLGKNDFGAGQ
jgi:hypothetical protein